MNWIDLIILVVLFVFIVHGAVKGAARRLVFIVAAILAYRFTYPFGNWLALNVLPMFRIEASTQDVLLPITAFILLLVSFWAVGYFIAGFFKDGALGFVNHILGSVLGFIIACALLSVIFALGENHFFAPPKTKIDARKHSKFYYPLTRIGNDILATKFRPEHIKTEVEEVTDFSKDFKKLKEQKKK